MSDVQISSFDPLPVSPYGVWVSEIMLQQTRVEAVIPYWCRWMSHFPTIQHLADATPDQVNAQWAGLGFYRRARLLHKGAQYIVQERQGEFPTTRDDWVRSVPGVGPYTAGAVASIAFGECVPVVDGNVCRVLSRLVGIANHIKAPILKDKMAWDLVAQIVQAPLPEGESSHDAGEVNQALMELGATYCAPSGTGVHPQDPLRSFYLSTRLGQAFWEGASQLSNEQKLAKTGCVLCAEHGVTSILDQWQEQINNTMDDPAAARTMGHRAFPLDPPKLKKREEQLLVLALAKQVGKDEPDTITSSIDGASKKRGRDETNATRWLLVKRPSKGLLAGQWEFPNICLESKMESKPGSSKKSEYPPPTIKQRKEQAKRLLETVFDSSPCDTNQLWKEELLPNFPSQRNPPSDNNMPLEHIFSHVKHIMWVETHTLSAKPPLEVLEWTTTQGQEARWMTRSDMDQVGITSGVHKVLGTFGTTQKKAKPSAFKSSTPSVQPEPVLSKPKATPKKRKTKQIKD
eukprot:Nitzschia sp. Nitz4//scaffold174_size87051//25959//27506//NITZ4_005104-RA/size87051-processed-gene-0.57-mRNA-1//1//CDS//3329538857//2471//frame0